MKEYIYEEGSWQNITDTIKQHFGWKTLTQSQAQAIMKLYLQGVAVEDMIKKLEEK